MKITITIDRNLTEEEVILQGPKESKNLESIEAFARQLDGSQRLTVKQEGETYHIEPLEFDRIFIENRKVWLERDQNLYTSSLRLYEVLELLPAPFLQISQSEIINTLSIDHLHQTPNGLIQIFMTNGSDTFSSRRYLKSIKEKLEL